MHDDLIVGSEGSAWFKTENFSPAMVNSLEEAIADSFEGIKDSVCGGLLSQEDAIMKLAHDTGSSFGMRNGCRESFSERFADLAVGMSSIFVDPSQLEDPEMPPEMKACFTGDMYTAAVQWERFLEHLNASRDERRDQCYIRNTANVLSLLTRYAVEVGKIIPEKK